MATNRQYQPRARPPASRKPLNATHRYVKANRKMNPPARMVARSACALPCTSSVVETATPTKPVKMLRTVTSRFWMNVGWFSTAAAATAARRSVTPSPSIAPPGTGVGSPGGASSATRAWPISQMPLTIRTAPTNSNMTPSSMFSLLFGRSVAEHPGSAGLVPVRQWTAGLAGDDVGLVSALLLTVEQPPERLREERQPRRREDPAPLRATARAGGRSRRLRAATRDVEGPALRAGERVDGHGRA